MSNFSYSILGILIFFDIAFITNYFVVRAFRRYIDRRTSEELTKLTDKGKEEDVTYKANILETILFGWILGKVKPDPYNVQNFPGWRPIPFFFGIFTTCILTLTALALLSPQFIYKQFGISTGGSLNGELCNSEDKDAGIRELRWKIKNLTNYDLAVEQAELMANVYSALQNDTDLYGQNGYTCPLPAGGGNPRLRVKLDGTKKQWETSYKDPAATYGNYFPGYCPAFLEQEIEAQKLATCSPVEVCVCPRFPRSAPWTWIGVGGKEWCLAKVCFQFFDVPCGSVSLQAQVNVQNYRAQQMQYAAERQEVQMNEHEEPDITGDISSGAVEAFNTFKHRVDVAANVYSIYACLALFFPSPLDVFRMPYIEAIKNFTFGAQKPLFMLIVLTVWWGYSHVTQLLHSPDLQLFFANLFGGDPCYLDAGYIYERQKTLGDICDVILPLPPDFQKGRGTCADILGNVDLFYRKCKCQYPMEYLYPFREEIIPRETASVLGFTKSGQAMHICVKRGDCQIWLPTDDVEFIGNTTICEDSEFARELLLQAPESDVGGFDMWISSGLLATFLIKFAMTNYSLGLLKLADPFVICAGKFLWIPRKFGLGVAGTERDELFLQFKRTKLASVWAINLREAIVWSVITHLLLLNLMKSTYSSSNSVSQGELEVMRACLILSGLAVVAGMLFIWCFLRKPRDARGKEGKKVEGNDEGDESDVEEEDDATAESEEV